MLYEERDEELKKRMEGRPKIYKLRRGKRHEFRWTSTWRKIDIDAMIDAEMDRGFKKFGAYNSDHEAHGVIQEEFDEWWATVKDNDPDPEELLQLVAVSKRALLELLSRARYEVVYMQDALKAGDQERRDEEEIAEREFKFKIRDALEYQVRESLEDDDSGGWNRPMGSS